MRVLGVDPGCYGAMAVLEDGRLVDVFDMPRLMVRRGKTDKAEVDGYALGRLLAGLRLDAAACEQVGGITGQSASAAFNFGFASCAPVQALKTFNVPVRMVPPGTWKKALKLNKGKDAAVAMATSIWPQEAHRWAATRGNGPAHQREGRAEAALIALWAWQQEKAQNGEEAGCPLRAGQDVFL